MNDRRFTPGLFAATWVLTVVPTLTVGADRLADCMSAAEPPTCVAAWAEASELEPRDLRALDKMAADPALALELTEQLGPAAGRAIPTVRAAFHDRRSDLLSSQGRHEEAAAELAAALEQDDGIRRLSWTDRRGTVRWSVGLADLGRHEKLAAALEAAGRSTEAESARSRGRELAREARLPQELASPTPLTGRTWFPTMANPEVEMLDEETIRLHEAPGDVLLINFWASWCKPCGAELPQLDMLYRRNSDRGFGSVAINMHEDAETARRFADDMGLRIPVGLAGAGVEELFKVRMMPTVLVADGQRRVRGRWNGYQPGQDDEIISLVERLLDEAEQSVHLADVDVGAGRLEALWMRDTPGPIDTMVASEGRGGADGGVSLVAAIGRKLLEYVASGSVRATAAQRMFLSRLLSTDMDGDGSRDILAFRPGGPRYVVIDRELAVVDEAEFPVAIVDAAANPAGGFVAATMDGLYAQPPGDEPPSKRIDGGPFRAVAKVPGAGWIAVDSTDRLWLDGDLKVAGRQPAGSTQAILPDAVSGTATLGFADQPLAGVVGRFLEGGRGRSGETQVALLASGWLRLLDAGSGVELFRARWPEARLVAAADLDGDGWQELAVATADRLVVLTRPRD